MFGWAIDASRSGRPLGLICTRHCNAGLTATGVGLFDIVQQRGHRHLRRLLILWTPMRIPVLATLILCPCLAAQPGTFVETAIGLTRDDRPIPATISTDDLDFSTSKTRVLLVGVAETADAIQSELTWFRTSPFADSIALSAVPDAMTSGTYPAEGDQYHSDERESAYLWRWIGMHAPDLVVEVKQGPTRSWSAGESSDLASRLKAKIAQTSGQLYFELGRAKPSDVGTIPALRVETVGPGFLEPLLQALKPASFHGPSRARAEIQARVNRKPVEVANQLAAVYGHELDTVAYIPAVALMGRLRLGRLTGDEIHLSDVERIVRPYLEGKPSFPESPSGSNVSGHLIFGELAKATGNSRYVALARDAADMGFDSAGQMAESMPFHNEMSDAVFMGCAILAQTGGLTGDRKYFDMALRHFRFMRNLCLREDGIYRHSPLDEAAWGRGNGFPALGLALTLSDTPESHSGRAEILEGYREHMKALLSHQDPTGMWHNVIDRVGSFRELTSTSMIGFALARGLRRGWLEGDEFRQAVDRAWYGLKTRVAADGSLVDVCRSTGKQKTIRDYFDRTAILGKDDRGGAMALLFATEIAASAVVP